MIPNLALSHVANSGPAKGLVIAVSLGVGLLTLWFVMNQIKLTNLQISKHLLENGDTREKLKAVENNTEDSADFTGRRSFQQVA